MGDAKRQSGGRFGPGNNAGGRKGLPEELRKEARSAVEAMLKPALIRLAELIESTDEKVAIAAVKEALDRNLGKAAQSLEVSGAGDSMPGVCFVVRYPEKALPPGKT